MSKQTLSIVIGYAIMLLAFGCGILVIINKSILLGLAIIFFGTLLPAIFIDRKLD